MQKIIMTFIGCAESRENVIGRERVKYRISKKKSSHVESSWRLNVKTKDPEDL